MSQFPPPRPDQMVPAQPVGVAGPATPSGGRRNVALIVVIVSALVLMPVAAVAAWFVLRGDGDTAGPEVPDEWPLDPQLQHSFEVDVVHRSFATSFNIDGTADDIYTIEDGDGTSTVTRYVDGELRWEEEVGFGYGSQIQVWDGRVLAITQGPVYGDDKEIDRIDPKDGSVMWSITAAGPLSVDHEGDRLYVLQYGEDASDAGAVTLYDIDTGEERNQVTGAKYSFADDGFFAIDTDNATVEFLDVDLEPVDGPVEIEGPGVSSNPWLVQRNPDDGVMYIADGSEGRQVVGKSWDGDVLFECDVTIAEPNSILLHDGAIAIRSSHEMEVLDLDGSTCEQRWSVNAGPDSLIYESGEYPVVVTYDRTAANIDYVRDDSVAEMLDWQTGEAIETGEVFVATDGKGKMATVDGDEIVARRVDGGDDLWRIEVTKPIDFWIVNGMLVVMTPHDGTATFDVYADATS